MNGFDPAGFITHLLKSSLVEEEELLSQTANQFRMHPGFFSSLHKPEIPRDTQLRIATKAFLVGYDMSADVVRSFDSSRDPTVQ